MYSNKRCKEDGKAEPRYIETDPTGRYARVGDILGKGAMKTVYKAIDEVLGIEVAWSQVKLNEALRKPEDLERLYLEVHLLSTLKHQSIMRFYTSWIDVDNKTFNFITEMFTSGTLREYRKKYKHIGLQAIKSWTRLILQGLVYLHEHDPPVIHRDLKCDNIFVNGHLGQVKIGDLGLAAILHGSQPAHSVIGTPEFMAPELYEEEYNELVDVYSFGMCVLEMLTSDYPYSECANPAQIYKKVTSGKLPASFFRIEDTEAQRFIGKCLITAAKRPSAKELLNDPFLLSDDASSMTKIGIQKPFLNYNEMEKLQLDDVSPRTEMSITGKLNPEHDTIFLKVQISDKDGSCRNVYFPFDIYTDTPIDVAMEMVKELEITDLKPSDIANMIEGEISVLLPNKRNSNCSVITMTTTTNHHFHSASSRSSSQGSISGSDSRADDLLNGDYWLHGDVLDDASSICSSHGTYSNSNFCSVDEQEENHKASTRKDKHLIIKSHMCTRFSPNEDPITLNQCKVLAGPQAPSTSKTEASSTMRIFLFMVPLLVLAGFASIKGSSVYNGRDSIAKRYALSSSLITRSNFSSQTFLPPPNSSLQTIYPSSNSSLQTLHQSNETEVNVSIPKSNSAPANESDESHPREKQKRKPSFLDRTEVVLAQARATIREAKNWNLTQDSDYVPIGPMYWNAKEFHRSYLEMEKQFKVFVYEEGELPVFHDGPCSSIYSTEGSFIHAIEMNEHFRTRDPKKANVFFLPFSIAWMVRYVYIRNSYDFGPIKRTVRDYVNVIATRYPYWNRSLGADHFMLSCHDWGPETSKSIPYLRKNSIRVLCNANTSEGFDPIKDASFPEINLQPGLKDSFVGGPPASKRSILAFFAGGNHGPIRPILLEHWENKDEDIQVHKYLPKGVSYYGMLRNSKFCLCPSGYEVASPRVVEAIYTGCVPVLISEHYVPPFSDVLNWKMFSVNVSVKEIPNLKDILTSISPRQYIRMQKRVGQIRRHFEVHSPPKRYDVFHMILHSVWLRRLNFRVHDDINDFLSGNN